MTLDIRGPNGGSHSMGFEEDRLRQLVPPFSRVGWGTLGSLTDLSCISKKNQAGPHTNGQQLYLVYFSVEGNI